MCRHASLKIRACHEDLLVPTEDLLAQDVRMPAVLSELTQDVKVHPAQGEWPAPVAVDHVVQPQL